MALGRGLQSLIPPEHGRPRTAEESTPVPSGRRENAMKNLPHEEERVAPQAGFRPRESKAKNPFPGEHHRRVSHGESVFQIEIEKIHPNPYQPRRDFRSEELDELARSIREFGILQPLVVSKTTKETDTGTEVFYQLVAGERRLKAAKRAGLLSVPAIVRTFDTGKEKLEVALVENIQRSDLNALETAKAYARLQDEFGLTQRQIAARVGKSRESVGNTLRLLNLPSHIQQALSEGKLNESQARTLLSIQDPGRREHMFRELLSGSVETIRELRQKKLSIETKDPEQRFLEKRLEEKLGAPVTVAKKGGRGKIIIQFYSDEEMRALIEKLVAEDF